MSDIQETADNICRQMNAMEAAQEIVELRKALALKMDAMPSGLSAGQSKKLEAQLEQLRGEVQKFKAIVRNDSDNEEVARKLACQVLPEKLVYGDRFGVPTIDEIVKRLVSMIRRDQDCRPYEEIRKELGLDKAQPEFKPGPQPLKDW